MTNPQMKAEAAVGKAIETLNKAVAKARELGLTVDQQLITEPEDRRRPTLRITCRLPNFRLDKPFRRHAG